MYKGIPIRLSADFLADTLQATRKWYNMFKVLQGKNLENTLPGKVIIQIKSFTDKQKLKEFIITKPALEEMLKALL